MLEMEFSRPSRKDPATILFATIPFEYLADTAAVWAERGIRGFMLAHIMSNWDSDVWLSEGKRRTVGKDNPLLQRTKRMNEVCREHNVDRNFIKVAFYSHLPDWFDDAGWARLLENFRQAAVFAREGLFRGLAIDIEYINEIYDLSWKDYQKPGYPLSQLREKSEERGAEIVRSMLEEFPEMEVLHLPQGPECYGPLATDLFRGMCVEMADRKAPGGLHLLTEETYQKTNPDWLLRYAQDLDVLTEEILPKESRSYWRQRCSVSFGLWPLGYYRDILDEKGKFLTVGNLAERSGVSPRTIKHWEDKGIIEPDMRTEGGFRLYSEAYVFLCQLIRDLQLFGYTLEEVKAVSDDVRTLLAIEADPDSFPRAEVEKKLEVMLEAIRALFGKMKLLREGVERWEDLLKKKKKDILALQAKNRKREKAAKEASDG